MSTDTDHDRETDEWVTATHIADALRKTADTIASDAASRDNSTPQEPVDASEAPLEVPASERPASRVPGLPRPINPEDVRVGMVVERRKGDAAYRDRVQRLIEDAPAPVDPDAELVERMAEAMWRIEENPPTDYAGAIDDPEGWQELARAALLALRETHVVTPRAEQ